MRNRRISVRPNRSHPRSHRHLRCVQHQTAAPPATATAARHVIEEAQRVLMSDEDWWELVFKE
ncbi:hypothetical protein [Mycolicibacterium llatzerense]|uniref:hypothetical protein n=1 Tax=Mycolicibacterium llatzerense TaxID=280871 RepID=UPI0008DDBD59|nr:hypothetical protein [Mycolicibacterium llatzerense]